MSVPAAVETPAVSASSFQNIIPLFFAIISIISVVSVINVHIIATIRILFTTLRQGLNDFTESTQDFAIGFIPRLKLIESKVVGAETDFLSISFRKGCRFLANTLMPGVLVVYSRMRRSLTNFLHPISQSLDGFISKKLNTCKSGLTLLRNCSCKSLNQGELRRLARIKGLDPNGSMKWATTQPHEPKLVPRCGVPRNKIALVFLTTFLNSPFAWASAWLYQIHLSKESSGHLPV